MRICYLGDAPSIHTQRWCSYFVSLGHEVHLVTFRDAKIAGVEVHFINAGPIKSTGGNWRVLLKATKVKRLLEKIKPDILHAHYATSYGAVGARTGFHPYIITPHGTDVLITPWKSRVYRWLLRNTFKSADLVLIVADHMREAVQRLGVPADKIKTITFGIDPEIFNAQNRELPGNEFVLTHTRAFEPVYQVDELIRSFIKLAPQIPTLRLHLAGDGSLREALEQYVMNKGFGNVIKFHGKLAQTEIAALLRKSHVYVSNSISDGNSISLLEALACGAFLVVTDIPAAQAWIRNDENGLLVPVGDVDALAASIERVYSEYDKLAGKAAVINRKLIEERGLLDKNMRWLESIYLEMASMKKQ